MFASTSASTCGGGDNQRGVVSARCRVPVNLMSEEVYAVRMRNSETVASHPFRSFLSSKSSERSRIKDSPNEVIIIRREAVARSVWSINQRIATLHYELVIPDINHVQYRLTN